jgi:hypothetical protein
MLVSAIVIYVGAAAVFGDFHLPTTPVGWAAFAAHPRPLLRRRRSLSR